MAAGVAVAAPFGMQEMLELLARFLAGSLVLGVLAAIPAGPDGGRIDIGNVRGEIAAPHGGLARRVQLVGDAVQLGKQRADLVLVEFLEVTGPVVFVAKSPENDGGVVAVLVDHVAEHAPRLLLVALATHAAAAPRDLFPNQQAQLIALIEHDARLLVMRETDEIRAHLLDHRHLFADKVLRHRGRQAGVILVAVCASEQQPLTVQLERTVVQRIRKSAGRNAPPRAFRPA